MSERDSWSLTQKCAACNLYVLVVNSDKVNSSMSQVLPSIEAWDRSSNLQTDHVLCVCFRDYLDKEETGVMKRRGDAEKGFPKSRSDLGKNNREFKGRGWRWLLQERSWKWGKILKMKEVGGDKCQGVPRDLDWWHPRQVTRSSCMTVTDGIFCPAFPGQQPLHCWKVKSRLSEGNTEGGGS